MRAWLVPPAIFASEFHFQVNEYFDGDGKSIDEPSSSKPILLPSMGHEIFPAMKWKMPDENTFRSMTRRPEIVSNALPFGFSQHQLQSRRLDNSGNRVSLRLKQKLARTEQMLEAARALFVANGYEKTTIEAIAAAASVGVATVYTYFENKEGLAAAIIRKDNAKMFEEADELFDSLSGDPADAVASLTTIFKDFNRFISAELLRDFITQAKGTGPISEALAWCHECQINLIDRVLSQRQTAGTVSDGLDTRLAAQLIADLLDRHVSRLTKSQDPGAVKEQLTDFIRLLFQNWSGKKTAN